MMANDQTGNKFDLNHKELDVFLKKYAELLVQECAEWIKNTDSDSDIGEEDAQALLDHFGIEQ